ncbi:MAG TPA: ATP-binding protein [Longimicrobiales bacterium]|nr:ATP-binding protein [Longimicrobiales bacterium]
MTRRLWPAVLAALSIVILGSYLVYTEYLVRQIRDDAAIYRRIAATIQAGLLGLDEIGTAENTLFEVQSQLLDSLVMPIVMFNQAGAVTVAGNLPFDADLADTADQRRVHEYAARLKAARPEHAVMVPVYDATGRHEGNVEIIFGDPPSLKYLRWVPHLQVGAGVLLMVVAFFIMRADMRAHREQLWSAMARELAHQMGTPLSSLSGWVEVLQLTADERGGMPDVPRIGSLMHADVQRLERVSHRFELIGKPPALQPVALDTVISELTTYFTPRLPHLARGIRLRARVDPELPLVQANQVLLVWALENIVKNAIDALAGRGGRIGILALSGAAPSFDDRERGRVHIIIADTGPGIAPDVKDRIFDPGVTTKTAGWGVGLSLSRRIIEELHHGTITVENRPRGGAVFDVMLPVMKM